MLSTAGQVFLGMSINCARCHDHKVDPISQREYYQLLAFFADVTDQDAKNLKKAVDRTGRRIDVMCVSERGRADTHVLLRGNPNLRGDAVEPGVPAVLADRSPAFAPGSGKRRALADWLTDPRNPRTARACVNRLWQYHFGRGIVPTSNDFGGLGEPPSHPELLDWLAAEFMDGGWSIKRIHRLIVLSSTYRMSSHGSTKGLAVDPSNRWMWRFPMRRLTAEEIRDAILSVSGTLNLKAGGPSIFPPIPREVLAGQSVPGQGWKTSPPAEASRRSVYVHIKRSLLVPILAVHDAADTDTSCPVRYTTTVPTQALGFLNGEFSNEQAAHLALRVRREAPAQPRIAGSPRHPAHDGARAHLRRGSLGRRFHPKADDRRSARASDCAPAILSHAAQRQRVCLSRLMGNLVMHNSPNQNHVTNRSPGGSFCGRTRREFLWEIGGGFGSVALAGLLGSDGFLARQSVAADGVTPFVNPARPQAASLAGQGQERHLPVHVRRPQPRRHLRLQAQALSA